MIFRENTGKSRRFFGKNWADVLGIFFVFARKNGKRSNLKRNFTFFELWFQSRFVKISGIESIPISIEIRKLESTKLPREFGSKIFLIINLN